MSGPLAADQKAKDKITSLTNVRTMIRPFEAFWCSNQMKSAATKKWENTV